MKKGPRLTINKTYYANTVHEWNLPAGHTCPHALVCRVAVDMKTGKFDNKSSSFMCYASKSERFPGVRFRRWENYRYVKNGGVVAVPAGCRSVRIHASGDFFSQDYFDMWLEVCRRNPAVEFWAFTKSVNFWASRLNKIPDNLILTASYGGGLDGLIKKYGLKSVRVINELSESGGLPIDSNLARVKDGDFCIFDTNKRKGAGCSDTADAGGILTKTIVYNPSKVTIWKF